MKITRSQLQTLIAEVLASENSILLETPPMSTTGTKMHANEPRSIDPDGYEGEMAKRSLYHMSQQAQQLHDMLQGDENLEPWVQAKLTKAADYLEAAFKAITYDKGPGKGRM